MAQYVFPGRAVFEWECAFKHPEVGTAEDARFIDRHLIRVTPHTFNAGGSDATVTRQLMRIAEQLAPECTN